MHATHKKITDRNSDDDRCEYRFDEIGVPGILVREGVLLLLVVIVSLVFGHSLYANLLRYVVKVIEIGCSLDAILIKKEKM